MSIVKIHQKKIKVSTKQYHIDNGVCADPRKCMERQAILEALNVVGIHPNKLRVTAGYIKATWGGYRWEALTPRAACNSLIQWDEDLRSGREVSVKPHQYTVTFRRTSKVQAAPKFTEERLKQIRLAQKAREQAHGTSDRKRYSRVVGNTYL